GSPCKFRFRVTGKWMLSTGWQSCYGLPGCSTQLLALVPESQHVPPPDRRSETGVLRNHEVVGLAGSSTTPLKGAGAIGFSASAFEGSAENAASRALPRIQ